MHQDKRSKVRAFSVSLAKNLGLALASLLFTLLLLEIVARVLQLGTGGFWEPHPLYGWRNIPGAAGWESCYGECRVHVRINSQGLRDREIPYEKNPEQTRILILGDSMTAAMQVPLEDTFAKVLEARLNGGAGDEPWEVVNAGVNGFGTDNALLFFRLEAFQYQPDLVILTMYLANDIYENSQAVSHQLGRTEPKPYFLLDEKGELSLHNFPAEGNDTFSIRAGSFLKKHFQLPRFIAQTMNLRGGVPDWLRPLLRLMSGDRGRQAAAAATQSSGKPDICDDEYLPEVAEAWDITKVLLRQIRQEVSATGAQFAVLAIPAAPQIAPPPEGRNWYCDRPNEELTTFLEAEGILYLDALETFRDHMLAEGDPLFYRRDFHMNVAGHHLAGQLLYQFVMDISEKQ